MRKYILLLTLWLLTGLAMQVSAQLINVNPDPNGEPWWAGGYEITPEMQAEYDALPPLILTQKAISTVLPYKVDNSKKKYFRTIFHQDGHSCAQAAGVGYTFTYMINRERDVAATDSVNLYPTHYTWNYLNKGIGSGSVALQGWRIIEDSGIPNIKTYGGLWQFPEEAEPYTKRRTVWMNGYEKYSSALDNRVILEIYRIGVGTPEGLETLKHYLHNYGEGDTDKGGGIVTFDAHSDGISYGTIPSSSEEAGKHIVKNWGTGGMHVMTIVGYNDSIKFDFNEDGEFTNPEGNMAEWEIGALKVANSYGGTWPTLSDSGFVYMPYRLLGKKTIEGGISGKEVYTIKVKERHKPLVVARIRLQHPLRNEIDIKAGLAENPTSKVPTRSQFFSAYRYKKRGALPMQGINDEPIEIELDVTSLLDGIIPGKFFLELISRTEPNGQLSEFTLIDYDTNDGVPIEVEYAASSLPVTVLNNDTTLLPIEYDYFPSTISVETVVNRDISVSKDVTIDKDVKIIINNEGILRINNKALSFSSGSSIEVKSGAQLIANEMWVENGSTLTLKSGSKLTLQEGARLVIKSGSTLNIHDCAELEILPGAKLVVQGDNTLRIAPDAILKAHDGHGSFNIHRNAIIPPGFVHPNEVVPPTYRISENQQWSYSSYNMHLDLVVENGAKLKLKNTTLRFSKYAGIRVKYGAELETDFGELTRQEVSCTPHELWKGIVVEGNVFFVQNNQNQGELKLDKTTVSYASTGVEVKGGGIAKITRSTFHNNLTGVAFRAYRPNSNDGSGTQNMSYVDYSTFTHDAGILLPHLKPSVVYIDLNGVTEIDIAGNTFENLAPNAGALNSRGYGIKALNADVKLEDGNTFKNLFMGIQASATMGLPGFTVSDQTFENCFNGVRVSAYPMPVIQNSQFLVPYYNGSEGVPTAISIVNLNSFSVEGNSILGAYSGYGVYLENQLPCSGNVIGNSLEKLSVGISAEGSLVQGNMGANTVQVLCNQFNDNAVSDILVRGEGLAGIQGTPEVSASNQFGRSAMHLISEDVPLVYYGYPQSGYLPTEVNARVRVLESDELSDCSSRLVAGFGVVELTGVARAQSDMVETEQFIAEVQDMGNTQDVIGAIEELAHTNPLGLRNELLNRSPMLSDTVMVRSSSDETDLPHIMLAQVLMANPQSTKSHAVVTALEEKTNPLPYYLMDAILAEGSTLSPLDILRSTASSHRATRDYVAGALTHRFVSDTLGKAYESIQLIGDYHPSIMYQYLSAFAAYESAGSEDALLLLNQMGSSGELTPSQQQVLQGVISFITLMDTAGEELLNVESEEYAELVSIASGENGLASILADNLISYLESTPFFAEEYMVERSGTAAIPPLYGPYVEVSPYPVSQYVIISYGMGETSYDVPLLRITDRAGKELHAQELTYPQFEVLVEVDHWKPGLYTVSLLDGQSILAENTFVIEGVEHFDDDHKDKDDTAYPMISVYPNPTPGIIRIVVNGIEGSPFTYNVYNDLGVSLAKGRGVGEKEVDLSRFGTGSYMIIVGCENQRYTISVMVK